MTDRQEIEELKSNWKEDPCWDIEETEGFEAHKQELYVFRLEQENKWLQERVETFENFVSMARKIFSYKN